MTRNEWICARVAVAVDKGASTQFIIPDAKAAADAMEAEGCAPWHPAPAQDDGEAVALLRRIVDAFDSTGIVWRDQIKIAKSYLARLDAAKGGAT